MSFPESKSNGIAEMFASWLANVGYLSNLTSSLSLQCPHFHPSCMVSSCINRLFSFSFSIWTRAKSGSDTVLSGITYLYVLLSASVYFNTKPKILITNTLFYPCPSHSWRYC